MATYAMTINERSNQGKALLAYLGTLDLKLVPISKSKAPCQFTKAEMRDILAQSVEEARVSDGTSHEDFKREIASWR